MWSAVVRRAGGEAMVVSQLWSGHGTCPARADGQEGAGRRGLDLRGSATRSGACPSSDRHVGRSYEGSSQASPPNLWQAELLGRLRYNHLVLHRSRPASSARRLSWRPSSITAHTFTLAMSVEKLVENGRYGLALSIRTAPQPLSEPGAKANTAYRASLTSSAMGFVPFLLAVQCSPRVVAEG